MMMREDQKPIVVLTTVPDEQHAQRIAEALVESRLAACVTVLPKVRSVYRWQGAIERSDEIQLLIKTQLDRYGPLQSRIRELHPYDVPEILAVQVVAGLPDYVDWVCAESAG
jgi:periplasmic divalent cation tolerance protein